MPYVEVWVDSVECDGDCQYGEKAETAMVEALEKLREGDQLGAIRILGEATDDKKVQAERQKEKELTGLYKGWLDLPMPRPDFLTFAHSRRKHTAA